MATLDVPSRPINEYLTVDRAALIRRTISSRRSELNATIKLIEEAKSQSDILTGTILQLQKANKNAKSAHKILKESLNRLSEPKGDNHPLDLVTEVLHMHGSHMETDSNEILNLAADQMVNQSKGLTQDISPIKQELSKLRFYIQKTEMEIYSNKLVHAALVKHAANAKNHQTMIEELLAKIFSLYVDQEIQIYLDKPRLSRIPVTALRLSQVCSLWRRIIFTETALWRLMAIYSLPAWSSRRISMLKHACIHKPAIPTFVADLSRYTLRSIRPEKWGWQAMSGAKTIPLVKTYDLTIVTGAADNVALAASPFIQPTSVTLHLLSTAPWRSFSRRIESLSGITRLDIICKTQYYPPSLRLPEAHPQLTHLELHLKKFMSIDIAEYLVPNLIELHIVQSQSNIMSSPPPGHSLPRLKVLGVTPLNTDFACSLDLPMLEKVVLYGVQKSRPAVVMTLVHFANGIDLGRVRNLELRNWSYSQRYWGTFGQGAMGLITEVADQMWSIVNLKCEYDRSINNAGAGNGHNRQLLRSYKGRL